jgi:glycosyltransferase involved in cell wall biosynthesis
MTGATPGLSVILPTRDRAAILARNLARLAREDAGGRVELVVVDDGSTDETASVLDRVPDLAHELRVVRRPAPGGPAAARNSGLEVARGPVLVFLDDDTLPAPGLLRRHLEFHRRHRDPADALLGRVVPAPATASPLTLWLHERGKQFAYASITPGAPVAPRLFNTANASLKRELVERAGRFDERFGVGNDDVELGLRLGRAGLRLAYDAEAVAEHEHPTDLLATLRRMRANGRSYRLLTDLHPEQPRPRAPGARHRLKAMALTALAPALARGFAREPAWAFLCEQAHREAFWGEPDPPDPSLRIGRRLAVLADRDPGVRGTARRVSAGR